MIPLKKALNSSLGKKYLMSVSGLAMVGFLVTHLSANLLLYGDGTAFNGYAAKLAAFGPLLLAAELGFVAIALIHIVLALKLTAKNKAARGGKYQATQESKGGPSYFNLFSRNMIVTGVVLLVFLVLHIMHMKYGLFSPSFAPILVDGVPAVDLFSRVTHEFKNPVVVVIYMAVMLVLGAHIRHGFFSAFQSIGALNPRFERPANVAAKLVAFIFVVGFLFIPPVLFLKNMGA